MRVLVLVMASLFSSPLATADPTQGAPDRLSSPTEKAGKAQKDRSFVVMPIPLSDPAIGTGLGIAGMALYHKDAEGRPWTTGLGGLYTDSESWAVAAFHKSYIADDRYRLTAAAGYGDFNVDFFGIGPDAGNRGRSIALNQKGALGLVDFLFRVQPNFFVGARYRGMALETTVKTSQIPFPDLELPDIERNSASSALGLSSEYDTRDSEYGPRHGIYATGQWLFANEAFGSDFDYQRAEAAVNGYIPLGKTTTLAWRGSVCWSEDGAPFYDLCNFGSQNDLRGYTTGQYRDHAMYAVQAEIRQPLFWRFGGVAFAGVGEVASGFNHFNAENLLPAAGIGLRFQASREYRVNASIDFAVGDGSSAVYFYIGEAF